MEKIYLPEGLYKCKTAVTNSDLVVVGGISQRKEYDDSISKHCEK